MFVSELNRIALEINKYVKELKKEKSMLEITIDSIFIFQLQNLR